MLPKAFCALPACATLLMGALGQRRGVEALPSEAQLNRDLEGLPL